MTPLRALFPLALALAGAACSGAAPQPLEEAPPSDSSSHDSGAPASTTTTSSSSSGGTSSGTPSSSGSGSSDDAGTFGAPAPSGCPSGAVVESGGNDTEANAQEFATAACGTVQPGSTDWWRFTLPQGSTKLAIDYSGHVTVMASSQGKTVLVGSSDPLPFQPTAEYDLQVTSSHSQPEPYVIVIETK